MHSVSRAPQTRITTVALRSVRSRRRNQSQAGGRAPRPGAPTMRPRPQSDDRLSGRAVVVLGSAPARRTPRPVENRPEHVRVRELEVAQRVASSCGWVRRASTTRSTPPTRVAIIDVSALNRGGVSIEDEAILELVEDPGQRVGDDLRRMARPAAPAAITSRFAIGRGWRQRERDCRRRSRRPPGEALAELLVHVGRRRSQSITVTLCCSDASAQPSCA